MTFKTDLDVRSIDAKTWLLLSTLIYEGTKGDRIIVEAGEFTDFATVPQITQMFFPRTGAWTKAAVVHDHLCNALNDAWGEPLGPGPMINAVDTDGIFRAIMREEGVSRVKRWLMWTGVRWGALFNPARRRGWLKTAPSVLGISAAALAVLGAVLAAITWVIPW